jgi:DNA gyrase subunit B
VYEAVDNAVDEALGGYCDSIKIILHSDGSVSIGDNGRGIPVDTHKETGKSAAEVVLTVLHAGGKFEHSAYKVSGGLHGVGISVVNALSEWLEVEIRRGGKVWTQRYEKGGTPTGPLTDGEATKKHGTIIRFKPDATIFEEVTFSFDTLSNRLRELAFLNKGLKIVIEDERDGRSHTFLYKGGIVEFVKHLNQNKTPIHPKVLYFEGKKGDIEVEWRCSTTTATRRACFPSPTTSTREGGTHLTGFRAALTGQLSTYAQNNGFLKSFKGGVTGDDVREGLCAVVSVRMPDPQFEGQTKAKLGKHRHQGAGPAGRQRADCRVLRGGPDHRAQDRRQVRARGPGARSRAQGARAHPQGRA